MEYAKLPLDFTSIIAMLKNRGLIIQNESAAIEYLKVIGYFRLENYLHSMELDKVAHTYKPNSNFNNAISLYNFDRDLRTLLFPATQAFEIALRTKLSHYASIRHGAFWFSINNLFQDKIIFDNCLSRLHKEVERSREDFITAHFDKYSSPDFPPSWKTFEITSFGTISKMLCNFNDNSIKKKIAREFNLPQHIVLENWVKCAVIMRNYIAHHSRIWNRSFPIIPQTHPLLKGKWINNDISKSSKLYPHICCLKYIYDLAQPDNKLKLDLQQLFLSYTNIDIRAMGFPKDWQDEPLWH